MEYALFLGLKRIGSLYPNQDEVNKAIERNNQNGIYNICSVIPIDGKLCITERKTVVINNL